MGLIGCILSCHSDSAAILAQAVMAQGKGKQLSLSGLFAGRSEVVPDAHEKPKRPVGRPPKVAPEAADPVLQAIEAQAADHQMLTEVVGPMVRRDNLGREGGLGVRMMQLAGLRGAEAADLRIPGGMVRPKDEAEAEEQAHQD